MDMSLDVGMGRQLPGRALAIIAALGLACAVRAQPQQLEDLSAFPSGSLEITHARAKHRFQIWIADTSERQQQGLMFVRDLPPERGMLFPMTPPRVANFWMKNTYIELDMVFIGTDGRIARIAARTRPLTLDLVSSGDVVGAVLEIKGGEAQRLGLKTGDAVRWERASHSPNLS